MSSWLIPGSDPVIQTEDGGQTVALPTEVIGNRKEYTLDKENVAPFEMERIDYPVIEEDAPMPPLSQEMVRQEAKQGLLEVRDFVTGDEFVAMLQELYALPVQERDEFVRGTILDEDELEDRGIHVPEGLKIQRSRFGDGRPTLFCVAKLLSDGVRKVTYTFDSDAALA